MCIKICYDGKLMDRFEVICCINCRNFNFSPFNLSGLYKNTSGVLSFRKQMSLFCHKQKFSLFLREFPFHANPFRIMYFFLLHDANI